MTQETSDQSRGSVAAVVDTLAKQGAINYGALRKLGGAELATRVRRTGQLTREDAEAMGGSDVVDAILNRSVLERMSSESAVSVERSVREQMDWHEGRFQTDVAQARAEIIFFDWFAFIEIEF